MTEPLNILLITDSGPFHGPESRLPLRDPRMYPNLMAERVELELGRPVELAFVTRAALSTRDAWQIVSKDIGLQEIGLPAADVVVISFGSADALAVGFPTWLKDLIPSITNDRVRRWARSTYWQLHGPIVALTGGRLRYVPRGVTIDLYERIIDLVRFHSEGAPIVAVGPQPTHAEHHGRVSPHSASVSADLAEVAARKDVAFVEIHEYCESHMDAWNADGLHFDFDTHAEVARRLTPYVVEAAEAGKHAPWADLLEELAAGG